MSVTPVLGNSQKLDVGAMFGNCPRTLWEKWLPPDGLGRIELACRCFLIETDDGKKILLETGVGAFFEPKRADRFGISSSGTHRLLENLKRMSVSPDDIDYVILSHLHFDHAGGLLPTFAEIQNNGERLIFSKAKFIVGKEALERAENPHKRDKASYIPVITKLLKDSGRMIVLEGETCPELKDDFEFIYSYGHTPGQLHTLYKQNSSRYFFCGDLIPGRSWIHPPITMGYDRFPELLIDEKLAILKRAKSENWNLLYTHDPDCAMSRVTQNEKGRWVPDEEHFDI